MNKIKWIILIGLNVFLLLSLMLPNKVVAPAPIIPPLAAEQVFVMANQYRIENGLVPVVEDSRMCKYAEIRAKQIMVDWSHSGFSNDGGLEDKMCPECTFFGENLAQYYKTSTEVMIGWKNSNGHNKNILNPRWDIGCIVVDFKNGVSYVAQEFADLD